MQSQVPLLLNWLNNIFSANKTFLLFFHKGSIHESQVVVLTSVK